MARTTSVFFGCTLLLISSSVGHAADGGDWMPDEWGEDKIAPAETFTNFSSIWQTVPTSPIDSGELEKSSAATTSAPPEFTCLTEGQQESAPFVTATVSSPATSGLHLLFASIDPMIQQLDAPDFSTRDNARLDILASIAVFLKNNDPGCGHVLVSLAIFNSIESWLTQCARRATSLELLRRITDLAEATAGWRRAEEDSARLLPLKKIAAQACDSRGPRLLIDLVSQISANLTRELDGNTEATLKAFADLELDPPIIAGFDALFTRIVQNVGEFGCSGDPESASITCDPNPALFTGIDPINPPDIRIRGKLKLASLNNPNGGYLPVVGLDFNVPESFQITIDTKQIPQCELADWWAISGGVRPLREPLPDLRFAVYSTAGNDPHYESTIRNDQACGGEVPISAALCTNGLTYVGLSGIGSSEPICSMTQTLPTDDTPIGRFGREQALSRGQRVLEYWVRQQLTQE